LPTIAEHIQPEAATSGTTGDRNKVIRMENQLVGQQPTIDMLGRIKLSDVIRSMQLYKGSAEKLNEFLLSAEDILLMIRGADQTPMGRFKERQMMV